MEEKKKGTEIWSRRREGRKYGGEEGREGDMEEKKGGTEIWSRRREGRKEV